MLAEFANVLIRKRRPLGAIQNDVSILEKTWEIVVPDTSTVSLALVGIEKYRMSFWDAMLWATAKQHRLTTILSENGPTGAIVNDVLYLSPF